MDNRFIRTRMLLGDEGMEKLKRSKVILFGVGGVGSYAAEALARCGIGRFVLVDHDEISTSNINRQIHALTETVGRPKVEVMKERMLSIHPEAEIRTCTNFFLPGQENLIEDDCDYIVDAIDTVTAKIELVMQAEKKGIPIISSMGTGNKLDPTRLEVSDIYDTSVCQLAKVMRKELKKRGVKKLKCVYSKEIPIVPRVTEEEIKQTGEVSNKRRTVGSISFVPSAAGLIIASQVVRDILEGC